MSVKLPAAFLDRMKGLLGDEFEAFLASYEDPRYYGLRLNPLKLDKAKLLRSVPFRLKPVPWAEEGYYYDEGDRPGKHPYYHAGLYYIQEPSAMVPAEIAEAAPGEKILDLCAAPGGKTTQLAGKLAGKGLLVANDNHGDRVKVLVKNIELFGIRNAVVTNEEPERLAGKWPAFFDKILIDAPCSGEGMFRKEEDMVRSWERHSVERCSLMQRSILRHAASMLAPGGRIIYSTCTFAPEENEGMIAAFLTEHPEFRVVPMAAEHGFAHGRPDWTGPGWEASGESAATSGTLRLWPHRVKGEGHFAAVLERLPTGWPVQAPQHERLVHKQGEVLAAAVQAGGGFGKQANARLKQHGRPDPRKKGSAAHAAVPDLEPWLQFRQELIRAPLDGKPICYGESLYLAPYDSPPLEGLKAARPGWHLGSLKRGRFEPSHALAMGLRAEEFRRILVLQADSDELLRYLKGETLAILEERIRRDDVVPAKGYVLVCADEWPVGWAKWSDGMLKNDYPPSWRWI